MKNSFKFIIGWLVVFGLRLLPFRPPNVEPILTTMMPFAKKFGAFGGFIFGFFSIVLYDTFQGRVGQWTWITGVAYGTLGILAFWYFKRKKGTPWQYVKFSIMGTLLYDAVTGLTIGPLMFGQSFSEAFYGQIPFTAMHLASNIVLAAILSPLVARWVVENEQLNISLAWKRTHKIA